MNIADIAKLAGVSNATVSRYFNNGYVSEQKKEAIRKVVEETGYKPSLQAQTLRTRRTKTIGVIAPKLASVSIGSVVDGMLSVINDSDYHMILAVTQNDPAKEVEYLQSMNARTVDGVILIGTIFTPAHLEALDAIDVPVVIVGQQLDGYPCVYHDDYRAMYAVTQHMLKMGREKIGYLGVTEADRAAGEERLRGYRDAVTASGHPELADNIELASFRMESGYEHVTNLITRNESMDGIVCATDQIAIGALERLREMNINVPGQMMISGIGDTRVARIAVPDLISAHFQYEESGRISTKMILERIDNPEDVVKDVKLGYKLVTGNK